MKELVLSRFFKNQIVFNLFAGDRAYALDLGKVFTAGKRFLVWMVQEVFFPVGDDILSARTADSRQAGQGGPGGGVGIYFILQGQGLGVIYY